MHPVFVARSKTARPIWFVTPAGFAKFSSSLNKQARAFVKAAGFEPKPGRHLILPSGRVLVAQEGAGDAKNPLLPGLLPALLPAVTHRFATAPPDARLPAFDCAAGAYQFTPSPTR